MADEQQPQPHAREIPASNKYFLFPVKTGDPVHQLRVHTAGLFDRYFNVELAAGEADFLAFMDIGCANGQSVIIESTTAGPSLLANIDQGDTIPGSDEIYRERLRPKFHFSSRRGWLNDPNGLVYYEGQYHLFYQHNPYGINWGNMHWGHAVSTDLVHWTELPTALYPDDLGAMFSGSAVVDWNNTAGFEQGPRKTLVCCYTAAGGFTPNSKDRRFTQCLAFSNDGGTTVQKYAGNPVLSHIANENRDPRIIWYEPHRKWVMALYIDANEFALFGSPDLKTWDRLCTINMPGCIECPEFFEIAVEGDSADKRWIFYAANGKYFIGRFDGNHFIPESDLLDLHHGDCFFASQTFSDMPAEDGRRIAIGWARGLRTGKCFNQMMNFPIELSLRRTVDGLRLCAIPVREISSLHGRTHTWSDLELNAAAIPLAGVEGEQLDVSVHFAVGSADEVGVVVRGLPITYNVQSGQLVCGKNSAGLKLIDGKITLRLLVDCSSVEIFAANDGMAYMPMAMAPADDDKSLAIFARGGKGLAEEVSVTEMKSIWPAPTRHNEERT